MKTNLLRPAIYAVIASAIIVSGTSCRHLNSMSLKDSVAIIDSVDHMTTNISRDLAAKGPVAWLDYFDHQPQFFMINDGQLSFSDYASAEKFIRDTLSKKMSKISLKWKDKRIGLITRDVVAISSGVHEDIMLASGQTIAYDGYFSGTAVSTPDGWKLINLHWSTQKTAAK